MAKTSQKIVAQQSESATAKRAGASVVPQVMVDDAARQRFFAACAALHEAQMERAASYLTARLTWMGTLCATALRDAASLVAVPAGGGNLTVDEIVEAGENVELLRGVVGRWDNARAAGNATGSGASAAKLSDAQVRADTREIHGLLLAAFDLRFAGDPAGRKIVSSIRRGAGDKDMLSDSERILTLCRSEAHGAWVASLPKGEAAAVERLAVLHAEFARRSKLRPAASEGMAALKDLLDRAWTVTSRAVERVRVVGVYHVRGDATREGDYAAFRRPKTRKPRARKA